jgi:hypothetical protein
VLEYGCPIWFSLGDERANRNRLIHPLQTVQNKCLRMITGAYRTTNVQVLEHEASVAPWDLRLDMLAVKHIQRTVKLCDVLIQLYILCLVLRSG